MTRALTPAALTALTALGFALPASGQSACRPVGEDSIYTCVHPGPGPTLVLAAGAGQDGRTWDGLVDELRRLGTVVTFDRPGLGRSPSVDRPRTPSAVARELRGVLEALGRTEPVVLVGHSMGGVHALRYADLFPASVSGVVLVDTPPPSFEEARMGLLTEGERDVRRATLADGRARAPRIVGEERDGAASEAWTFSSLPPDLPLVAIVADAQFFGDLGSEDAHRALWLRLSRGWLELSTESELVVAEGSGHMVHVEQPDLVTEAVRRILARMPRSPSRPPPSQGVSTP